MEDKIQRRWMAFWRRLGARGNPNKLFGELVQRYSEPRRAYHNLNHISQCLDELWKLQRLGIILKEVEMAIWFHDAIYDTRAKDNEEKSAELAQSAIRQSGLSTEFGLRVVNLILATKHTAQPIKMAAGALVDIDLAILGQPEEIFDEYERQIRKEYDWAPEDRFRAGRIAVLNNFLQRPHIYATNFFGQQYEAQARKNLKRSIEKLQN